MRALLDINVIIALLDRGHVMHKAACVWMEQELEDGWATSPITENGVMRIMSQSAYPNHRPSAQVAARLTEACNHPSHQFWPEGISLLQNGLIHWERLLAPRQITDCYLLALAVTRGGRFVSFDQRISLDLVPSSSVANLSIIPPGAP
jgi:toxin-antitoxin system PIN domain toxin